MGRNLAQSSDSDMVQGALALEPGKCTFNRLALDVQSFPLRRFLLFPEFSQQFLVASVDLNDLPHVF